MTKNELKRIFYNLVKDANVGMTLNICKDGYDYVRFNYIENGKILCNEYSELDFFGDEKNVDEEFEAEFSNGTFNYLPTLMVDNSEMFFDCLYNTILKYIEFYNLGKLINKIDEESLIKNIILTLFSNARYSDYENPIQYLKKYTSFFDDNTLNNYNNTVIANDISILENSSIIVNNIKDEYGYETPYAFNISIKKEDNEYHLPIINYGICNNTCYIYSIQNKKKNEDNVFNKKIRRILNKVNAGVENDTDYEKEDTILGTTPSFILSMIIFFEILNNNNINDVRVVTFLPDRYMEKLATSIYDADKIQHNLTEKMVLLFYRLEYHILNLDINFPLYDGFMNVDEKIVDDLIIKLPETISCDNNNFLHEILLSIDNEKKDMHRK